MMEVTVYGPARPQGSKRAVLTRNGKALLIDASEKSRPWRESVTAEMARNAPVRPLEGAVEVWLTVYVARPKAHYGTGRNAAVLKPTAPRIPACGADLDKIARAVGDAGTGVVWRDDRQIAVWGIRRSYAEDGRERTLIGVWAMEKST